MLTIDQVREQLKAACNGNQAAWARQHRLAPAYVSDVLNDRRDPGEAILQALGLERVVTYRPLTRRRSA